MELVIRVHCPCFLWWKTAGSETAAVVPSLLGSQVSLGRLGVGNRSVSLRMSIAWQEGKGLGWDLVWFPMNAEGAEGLGERRPSPGDLGSAL